MAIITNNDWINTLIIANADGSGMKKIDLPEPYMMPGKPHWSPDSNYLIMNVFRGDWTSTQCIIDKEGNNFKDISILINKPKAIIPVSTWSG